MSFKQLFYLMAMISFIFIGCEEGADNGNDDRDIDTLMDENSEEDRGTGLFDGEATNEYTITAVEHDFDPRMISATPGQKIEITLVNEGEAEHNIEFELPGGEEEFDKNVAPGESSTMTITAPDEAGNYTFYCPVDDHRDQGMEGTLVVQ